MLKEGWSVEIFDTNPRFLCGIGSPSKQKCPDCSMLADCEALQYLQEKRQLDGNLGKL